jgi:hypothetical protein
MPTRIQRKRTKDWTLAGATTNPLGAVIVSRPSRYGNRCKVATMTEMGYDDPHAAAAENYRAWLNGDRLNAPTDEADQQRERILDSIPELRGKDVACTCRAEQACHGDYLLHLAALPVDEYNAWASRVRTRVDRNRVWRGDAPLHPVHYALTKAAA